MTRTLRPSIIDREMGYRYYTVGQLQKIQSITPQKDTTLLLKTRESFNEFEATFLPKEKKHQEGQLVDDCTMNPNEI